MTPNELSKVLDSLSDMDAMTRSNYHLTLGEYIETLKKASADYVVKYETGGSPGMFDSYRGYYRDLAIDDNSTDIAVVEALSRAKEAVGATFTGYKGGEFKMNEDTPLWRAEYGCCGEAILLARIVDLENVVILYTKEMK